RRDWPRALENADRRFAAWRDRHDGAARRQESRDRGRLGRRVWHPRLDQRLGSRDRSPRLDRDEPRAGLLDARESELQYALRYGGTARHPDVASWCVAAWRSSGVGMAVVWLDG